MHDQAADGLSVLPWKANSRSPSWEAEMFHAYRFIIGGFASFVLGFMLLAVVPGVQRWRGLAAFPLGAILIWIGVRQLREVDE